MALDIISAESGKTRSREIEQLREKIENADAILIGAGAGLSTSAGFTYSDSRFHKYFGDFIEKYHFRNMYEGGFYPFETLEEYWAYWSRYIYINRYMDAPKPAYDRLFELVRDKDYFVLTTNVDHCFRKAGFAKERLFYTQGDYGLFQCSKPCHRNTYDNEETVRKMVLAQGYTIAENGGLLSSGSGRMLTRIPSELVPHCPICHRPMGMNLRADNTFVEDDGWHRASKRYQEFTDKHRKGRVLYLELGVGYNTPGVIKYPFWQMTAENPKAVYACINYGEAYCPKEIEGRAICIDGDIGDILCRCDNDGNHGLSLESQ